MIIEEENYLSHYGILRKSGRYPWGSGRDEVQRSDTFFSMVDELRNKGLKDSEIAEGFGMKLTELRYARTIAREAKKSAEIAQVQKLIDKNMSNVAIGKKLGKNESSIRSLRAAADKEKNHNIRTIADFIKDHVDRFGFIDVGTGVENYLGVSKEKLGTAVAILKDLGYETHNVQIDQLGTAKGNKTTIHVVAPPGTKYKDIVTNKDKIRGLIGYSDDGGRSFDYIQPPIQVNSRRIDIRYAKDGGKEADGVIFIRPGVADLSLGKAHYAQVRIAVDGTHYLKGMAMYKDDLPPGKDLVFNTNKDSTGNKKDAMKELKRDKETGELDPDNPFGSFVRQIKARDSKGVERVTSAMNIVNEEGNWEDWNKNLSSQMLSKQAPKLAKRQLDLAFKAKQDEFDEILSLTNPAVRVKLLQSFSDDADASAVHLRAAHMPRQKTQVILPMKTMKPTEVYAPNFRDGERVVLIRFPHGGTFEIPELTVNNRNPTAKKLLGNAEDAIGIHHKVAERLSGADFDGDTVVVIPHNGDIKTSPSVERLMNFDPQHEYKGYEGMPKMKPATKGQQMGMVSNLITDMTIKKAPMVDLVRAVRHSMVVIDAEKHGLDYKRSAIDHGIPELYAKYQAKEGKGSDKQTGGASTLISRRKSRLDVPRRVAQRAAKGGPIDKATGEKLWEPTGETFVERKVNKRTGVVTEKVKLRTTQVTKLSEAKDAHELSSGTAIEKVYADHSNRLKSMANLARKEMVNTPPVSKSDSAKVAYADEVKSLNAKLNIAVMNRPRERQAQVIANAQLKLRKQANPDMEPDEKKKMERIALATARARTKAKKDPIDLTPREWEAIQAGAISNHKLKEILDNTDLKLVKEYATPKTTKVMSDAKTSRALGLLAAGHTQAEVADILGVSLSTLKKEL